MSVQTQLCVFCCMIRNCIISALDSFDLRVRVGDINIVSGDLSSFEAEMF